MSAEPIRQSAPPARGASIQPASAPRDLTGPNPRVYDGVICLGGEDWWYHNRGHFDMQMMREFSAHMPVLYVNSVGMRVPSMGEGRMFLTRVSRKLKSYRRGVVPIRDGFSVASPVAIPGRLGNTLTAPIVQRQINRAAAGMGMRRPLLWVANPRGAELIDGIDHGGCVYQRTDRFEDFLGVNHEKISGFDRTLKAHADLTVYCSGQLHEEESAGCRSSALVDHGVDYGMFAEAGQHPTEPADLRGISRPRVGFVGGIDAHTFDPELFVKVATRLSEFRFVMVGACSLPADWCELPNVHLLGRREYGEVAAYMASCDVLIMPWNRSEWIQACNPIKLKEYLAVGKPVVSTPYPQLAPFEGLVRVAEDAESFAHQISRAVSAPHDPEPGRRFVERSTWAAQADLARDLLGSVGVHALTA